jgi:hypothetical protein
VAVLRRHTPAVESSADLLAYHPAPDWAASPITAVATSAAANQVIEAGPEPFYQATVDRIAIRSDPAAFARLGWQSSCSWPSPMRCRPVVQTLLVVAFGCSSLFITAGCSASFSAAGAETTTPAYLRSIARMDSTNHLAYMGTDGTYQYVFHSQLGGGGSYRVLASDWAPPQMFPLGDGTPYLLAPSTLLPNSR